MIGIIIEENVYNYGRPLSVLKKYYMNIDIHCHVPPWVELQGGVKTYGGIWVRKFFADPINFAGNGRRWFRWRPNFPGTQQYFI